MKVVCVETVSERFLQHFHHFLPLHNLLRAAPLLLFAARFPATHSLFIVQHSPVATEILMAVALPDSMAFPRPCIRVPWPPSLFIASLSLYFRCRVLLYLTIKYRYLTLYMSRHGSCASWIFMICSRNPATVLASVSFALENTSLFWKFHLRLQ